MPPARSAPIEELVAASGRQRFVVMRAVVGAGDAELHPDELRLTTAMSQRRLATFTAGRAAAAAALGALGEPPSPVTIGTGGAPQWPTGIVGSISHTDTTAYAIVGLAEPSETGTHVAVGIDVEQRGRIEPEMIPSIMTGAEQRLWASLSDTDADRFATLVFSAKEALYKAQFALTRSWLGFEHVTLANLEPPSSLGTATHPIRADLVETPSSPLAELAIERPICVRSLVSVNEVISVVVLRRPVSSDPTSQARPR